MRRLALQRLLWIVPTLLFVSFAVFAFIDLAPGDAARSLAGQDASEEQVAAVRQRLGLDEPLLVRYGEWASGAVTGDLSESLLTSRPVTDMLWEALPRTISLTFVALVFSTVVGFTLGAVAALRPGGAFDRLVSVIAALGIAVPGFFLALILVSELAIKRSTFPALGYVPFTESPWEWLRHLILPAVALSTVAVGEFARHVRTALRGVLTQDYILVAHAKGSSRAQILFKHALRNAAIPLMTLLGVRFAQLLGGAVIIEQIFLLRGMGSVLITAVQARDIPVVLGVVAITTLLVVAVNLLVDLSYGYLNPKLRRS